MFQIKICGTKTIKDAQLAALAGADAIGLNFYENSSRFVEVETARKIIQVVPPKVVKVGVFVNETAEAINQMCQDLGLDAVQLHGDEPPEFLTQLQATMIVRAFRVADPALPVIKEYLDACQGGKLPHAILVDAHKPGEYGGTGETLNWKSLATNREQFRDLPLVLAGGLTPFNVMEAIATVRPQAVDSASGVESQQGDKDPMLVRAFAQSAKKAFAQLAT